MKKQICISLLFIALGAVAKAQITHRKQIIPNFANWVIESNVKTPKKATVKFYNCKQELIYQEEVVGVKLKVKNKQVVEKLNTLLNQLISEGDKVIVANLVTAKLNSRQF